MDGHFYESKISIGKVIVVTRFWDKVNKDGPIQAHVPHLGNCWQGIGGAKRAAGYGDLRVDGQMMRAHRYSWELHFGKIPEGFKVLHKCDYRLCVRPDHLFIGTTLDNMRDRAAKGRNADTNGEKNPFHKLTSEQVLEMRSSTDKTSELAKRYNVTYEQVWKIRAGRAWTHLLNQPRTENTNGLDG